MDHNRLIVRGIDTSVYDEELQTMVPVESLRVLWSGEGIPDNAEWEDIVRELEWNGCSVSDLARQERRTFRIGGITMPLGWRDTAPAAASQEMPPTFPGAETA